MLLDLCKVMCVSFFEKVETYTFRMWRAQIFDLSANLILFSTFWVCSLGGVTFVCTWLLEITLTFNYILQTGNADIYF